MRIAQVAPLWESVPPKLYGGTERIVFYLTEELVRLGHDVTFFARGGSCTPATLDASCGGGLRLNQKCKGPPVYHFSMLHRGDWRRAGVDLIHFPTQSL